MTNADYIKENLKDIDIAWMLKWGWTGGKERSALITKAYDAWARWASSTTKNTGNMAKGVHGNTIIKENPSIWYWEKWAYPDGEWRTSGRTEIVSLQVWLSKQYNPEEWE